MLEKKRPLVGVGVFVIKDNKILMGKRKGAHGLGTWGLPGGHLEWDETPEQCAEREVLEETGVRVKNLRRGPFSNDIFEASGKHYITLFIVCDYDSGDVTVCEPEVCEIWSWVAWDNLPEPLFLPLYYLIKTNFNPLL